MAEQRAEGFWWVRHEGRADVVRVGRPRADSGGRRRPVLTCDIGPQVFFTDGKYDERGNAIALRPDDPTIEWVEYLGTEPGASR